MNNIFLASSSPRRQELLTQIKIPYIVRTVPVDEDFDDGGNAAHAVESIAYKKANAAARGLSNGIVIGADTVVVLDGTVLGKPDTKNEALQMLHDLQGRLHEVYTGLAIINAADSSYLTAHEKTEVQFRKTGTDELKAYVSTGEPMDKAGAYGIQGIGAVFISQIKGCYYNVVGLPITKLIILLREFGINITASWN
ncbi:MAG: Maf family protein [Clostridiales bacterium]|nr:Maf family protein [Clostridiales bacterium]MCF8022275.1 Maf family protein [Clostridiales bacterium]